MSSNDDAEVSEPDWVAGQVIMHVFFLVLSIVILWLSFVLNSEAGGRVLIPGLEVSMPTMCGSKVLLGIECPGCGLTRAFISISHGQFGRAWIFNRASFLVYAFVAAQIPWHSLQLWRRMNKRSAIQLDFVYYVPVLLAAALVLNWMIKFIG